MADEKKEVATHEKMTPHVQGRVIDDIRKGVKEFTDRKTKELTGAGFREADAKTTVKEGVKKALNDIG